MARTRIYGRQAMCILIVHVPQKLDYITELPVQITELPVPNITALFQSSSCHTVHEISCHMEVLEVAWQNKKDVQWEKVTCRNLLL